MQEQNRAYFVSARHGWEGGGAKPRSSSIPQKCSILFDEKSEYYHELEDSFKVQGGWGGGDFAIVSRRQNMRDILFTRIP